MRVKQLVAAAGVCALATTNALAQKAPTGASGTLDLPPQNYEKVWPLTLPTDAPAWSPQDIQLAQARCSALLNGLDVVAVPESPLQEGRECGTPAPMKLISIGKIAFSPPPLVTCEMIAALHKWMQQDVQPLARKHLGAPIVRVETMSSYSCRNAYGKARGRLSEHGRVNAVDISAFITAKNLVANVINDWGPTGREIAAQGATPKPAEQTPPPVAAATKPRAIEKPAAPSPAYGYASMPSLRPSLPGIMIELPGQLGLDQPSRLGGPKSTSNGEAPVPAALPGAQSATAIGKTDFLRAAHRAACRIFGTVLGPEANSAHRNHFHVDMAERIRNTKVCE